MTKRIWQAEYDAAIACGFSPLDAIAHADRAILQFKARSL